MDTAHGQKCTSLPPTTQELQPASTFLTPIQKNTKKICSFSLIERVILSAGATKFNVRVEWLIRELNECLLLIFSVLFCKWLVLFFMLE